MVALHQEAMADLFVERGSNTPIGLAEMELHMIAFEGYMEGIARAKQSETRGYLENILKQMGLEYMLADSMLRTMDMGEGYDYLHEVRDRLAESYGRERDDR